jgi:hypothetical protein
MFGLVRVRVPVPVLAIGPLVVGLVKIDPDEVGVLTGYPGLSVPLFTVTLPEYVLAPVIITVPELCFVRLPLWALVPGTLELVSDELLPLQLLDW